MADLAATTGVFGETATGVTLGALAAKRSPPAASARTIARRAARHGRRLEDAWPVAHTYDPIMIEADADAFVDAVLVA